MTKAELIVGLLIAIASIAVALLIAYCADNKGYVSDEEWERSCQKTDEPDEEVKK